MGSLFSHWFILFGCFFIITSGNAYSLDRKIDNLLDEVVKRLLDDIDAPSDGDVTDFAKKPLSKTHTVNGRQNSNKNDLSAEEVEERNGELVNKFQTLEKLRTNNVKTESVDQRIWWKCWCPYCDGSKKIAKPVTQLIEKLLAYKCNKEEEVKCKCPKEKVLAGDQGLVE